jgi:ubiquinone/menaquinone biosynthesis C-methylase UbiE
MRRPRSNIEWLAWGAWDPLYGVASLPGRNKRGENPWTDEEFYSHGVRNWGEYRPQWERYGVVRRSCVEIGCGAGRITKQLAGYFQEVHALDVSRHMLDYAQRHIKSRNVSFYVTDGCALPFADCSATAAFSSEVFQHFNRVSLAEDYLAELHRVLDPGASLMIHLPIYTWPGALPRTFARLYSLCNVVESIRANSHRFMVTAGLAYPFMCGVMYDSSRLYQFLWDVGFRDIEIRFFQTPGEGARPDFRSYLFARKPTRRMGEPS